MALQDIFISPEIRSYSSSGIIAAESRATFTYTKQGKKKASGEDGNGGGEEEEEEEDGTGAEASLTCKVGLYKLNPVAHSLKAPGFNT